MELETQTEVVCLLRKFNVHNARARGMLNVINLACKPSYHTRSEALKISSETECSSLWLSRAVDKNTCKIGK